MRRPLLIGGLSLAFGLWGLNQLQHSLWWAGEWLVLGAIAAGTVWAYRQRWPRLGSTTPPRPSLDRATVARAIAQAQTALALLSQESLMAASPSLLTLQSQVDRLTPSLERSTLTIALLGAPQSGKTTLQQSLQAASPLTSTFTIQWLDTSGEASLNMDTALASDLVLFLTAGDLADSDWQPIQKLHRAHQRVVLVLTKQDQLLPEEQTQVLAKLQSRLSDLATGEFALSWPPLPEIVTIAAQPAALKVRQFLADGTVQESWEPQGADIQMLTTTLVSLFSQEHHPLVWGTAWRQAQGLQIAIQGEINRLRRERSMPIVEQYQWIAAAATFANPAPMLDLLATTAITGQMVIELAAVYRQSFSVQQAQIIAQTLAEQLFKLGLVELSTQVLGSVCKSNLLTYSLGGTLQGLSAAYLTRLAGLGLIEYFQDRSLTFEATATQPLAVAQLGQKLQWVFQQNQRWDVLQGFVKKGLEKLAIA